MLSKPVSYRAEKYRDKFKAAQASLAQQSESIRRRTRFIEEDINDTDIGSLLETILHEPASLHAQHPHDIPSDTSDSAGTDEAARTFITAQQGARAGSLSDESEMSVEQSDLQARSETQGDDELIRLRGGCGSLLLSDCSDSGVSVGTGICGSSCSSSGGGNSGGGRAFDSLLIFCNNVAFNQGTIHRYSSPLDSAVMIAPGNEEG